MHNSFFTYLTTGLLFIFSCNKYQNQQEIKENNTTTSQISSNNFDYKKIIQDDINLPIGFSSILLKDISSDSIARKFDLAYINYTDFCNLFNCNEVVSYKPVDFKEDYFEDYTIYENHSLYENNRKDSAVQFILSSKCIKRGALYLKLAIEKSRSPNETNLSIFLLSIKDDNIIDSKRIYYNEAREMGYTYGRRFYIDKNLIISTRDYAFTEEGIIQIPFYKYQVNTDGKFLRYYDKNGNFTNDEEQGTVKNHTREGKWIEMKPNRFTGGYTYLEAEYKGGLPVGEFKYYDLEQEYNDKGEPILSTRKKGKLLYTETYENGELKERKFIK